MSQKPQKLAFFYEHVHMFFS